MSRLRELNQGKAIKILESNGFSQARSGKHITFKRTDSNGNVLTTWVPHHKEASIFVIKLNFATFGSLMAE